MIKKIPHEDHEEWLAIRSKYIGGSDAGTVVGLNPYNSPYALWAEKTGQVKAFEGNVTTKVGSYLEELVAQMFEDETGKKVRRNNFTMVNDKYPWACANVDREVVGEDAILEIKTTNNYDYIKLLRDGTVIPTWWAQMTHYMTVCEKRKAYLAVLMDCKEFKIMEFDFSEAESEALMGAERTFWDKVSKRIPPETDGSEATSEAIKKLFPEDTGGAIDLVGLETVFDSLKNVKKQIKDLTDLKDSIENEIKMQMGDAGNAKCGSWKVSWKNQTRSSFDGKKFKEDFPEMDISGYYNESVSRVFRVSGGK